MYKLCGGCLHDVKCHEQHNGHFMYCGVCWKLCDMVDFNTEHKPTSLEKTIEVMSKREHGEYIVKPSISKEMRETDIEIKKLSKQEKDNQEELWSKYSK